jgi:hypothetical protein
MDGMIRDKALSERLTEEIFNRVHQDIGEASMCWSNIEGAGTFQSEEASRIAFELCHYIADELDAVCRKAWGAGINTK